MSEAQEPWSPYTNEIPWGLLETNHPERAAVMKATGGPFKWWRNKGEWASKDHDNFGTQYVYRAVKLPPPPPEVVLDLDVFDGEITAGRGMSLAEYTLTIPVGADGKPVEGPAMVRKKAEPIAGPDEDGWISWTGTKEPPPQGWLEYRMRDGDIATDYAQNLRWNHMGTPGDIVAYRLARPTPATPPEPWSIFNNTLPYAALSKLQKGKMNEHKGRWQALMGGVFVEISKQPVWGTEVVYRAVQVAPPAPVPSAFGWTIFNNEKEWSDLEPREKAAMRAHKGRFIYWSETEKEFKAVVGTPSWFNWLIYRAVQ